MDNNDINSLFKDESDLGMFEKSRGEKEAVLEKMRNEKEKKVYNKLICSLSIFLFFGFLAFLFFLSVIDSDEEYSMVEKRALAKRPSFTFSTFFDGSWSRDFEDYYSDNFPFRESFIAISKKAESFLTKFSFGENDSVIVKVKKNEDDFGGEGLTEATPGETTTVEQTTEKPETTTDNNTYADEKTAKVTGGSILVADKRAMEIFSYYDGGLQNYASVINSIADSLNGKAKVYSLVAPTSIEFYGTKKYRTGSHSQKDAISTLYGYMNPNVITVDAYSKLSENTKEYIYFRTDHHWTARGAYHAYEAFCEAGGQTPVTLDSFATQGRIPGDFLGTLYAQTQMSVLAENPDYVEYFSPDGVSGSIYQSASMDSSMSFYVVAQNVNSSNKYLAFIAGDQPLEKITTSVKNGRKIIVLKESYGNAFVPFLCSNYEEIYVLDPRKMTLNLSDFVTAHSINDVLFINYAFGVFNPTYLAGLGKMGG
ncbi:MAG: hypothetical protein IJU39_05835 [Clostridia bacterium]|nr:hypothetical protein [Clostridia bacterium]